MIAQRLKFLVLILTVFCLSSSAQSLSERGKQMFSMEIPGYWDFSKTGWYKNQKKYSGWNGWKFKESKSKQAVNIGILRLALAELQNERAKSALEVKDTITPVFIEHGLLYLDRINEVYHTRGYDKSIRALADTISANLTDIMRISKGKFKGSVDFIQGEYDIIVSEVDYLRKNNGGNAQLESEQRREGFDSCLERLQVLADRSKSLYERTLAIDKLVGFKNL